MIHNARAFVASFASIFIAFRSFDSFISFETMEYWLDAIISNDRVSMRISQNRKSIIPLFKRK